MDLGSAIMSAEMALDFLPPEISAPTCAWCAAPVVEGAIAAAVQASLGGSLDEVAAEAMGALAAKIDQLSQFQPQPPLKTKVTHPLAGRAGHRRYDRESTGSACAAGGAVCADGGALSSRTFSWCASSDEARRANAKSINAVASFGARQNEVIRIYGGRS